MTQAICIHEIRMLKNAYYGALFEAHVCLTVMVFCFVQPNKTWIFMISDFSTSTFDLVGKNLQISHQPLKTKMNVKNVKKKKKKKKKKTLIKLIK